MHLSIIIFVTYHIVPCEGLKRCLWFLKGQHFNFVLANILEVGHILLDIILNQNYEF